jgi:polyhydroxyalkanoate synthesis regulator phasin
LRKVNEIIIGQKKGAIMTEETKAIMDELQKLNRKITDIQLTLENETNRNIKIIAEGHLDLSKKLDDALKVESEKEMLLLRVNHLENEIRRIKQRIEEIT